jgi:hypothetical protein
VLASLIETAKFNGSDSQNWMTWAIARDVDGHLQSRLDELLPWGLGDAAQALGDAGRCGQRDRSTRQPACRSASGRRRGHRPDQTGVGRTRMAGAGPRA